MGILSTTRQQRYVLKRMYMRKTLWMMSLQTPSWDWSCEMGWSSRITYNWWTTETVPRTRSNVRGLGAFFTTTYSFQAQLKLKNPSYLSIIPDVCTSHRWAWTTTWKHCTWVRIESVFFLASSDFSLDDVSVLASLDTQLRLIMRDGMIFKNNL